MTPVTTPGLSLDDFDVSYLASRIQGRYSIDVATGCWNWTMSLNRNGYGKSALSKDGRRLYTSPHRVAWVVYRGPIAGGLHMDHLCRNRKCINPEHLEPVTHSENLRRGAEAHGAIDAYGQCRTHGRADGYSTCYERDGYPRWVCRICSRARARRWRDKHAA